MSKEKQIAYMREIIQAYEDGEEIEYKRKLRSLDDAYDEWDGFCGQFNFWDCEYRVKPEPPIIVRKHLACYYEEEKFMHKAWTPDTKEPNCEIHFDRKTGKLLKVEVL